MTNPEENIVLTEAVFSHYWLYTIPFTGMELCRKQKG